MFTSWLTATSRGVDISSRYLAKSPGAQPRREYTSDSACSQQLTEGIEKELRQESDWRETLITPHHGDVVGMEVPGGSFRGYSLVVCSVYRTVFAAAGLSQAAPQ